MTFLLDQDVPDDIRYSLDTLGHRSIPLRQVLPTVPAATFLVAVVALVRVMTDLSGQPTASALAIAMGHCT